MSKRRLAVVTCSLFVTAGCASLPSLRGEPASGGFFGAAQGSRTDYTAELREGRRMPIRMGGPIPREKITTDTRALAAEGIWALQDGRIEQASQLFNTALRLDLSNSSLQFMNALTYHLMAVNGDAQKFTLAEQGYALAYKFDPTSVLALYYQGLAFLDQRKYAEAKSALASAALMDDQDAEILYDLARAAYLAGDPRTAGAALKKLSGMKQTDVERGKLLRASIITNAALGDSAAARSQLAELRTSGRGAEASEFLSKRIVAWERIYAENSATPVSTRPETVAQLIPRPSGVPVIPGASQPPQPGGVAPTPAAAGPGQRGDPVSAEMTVVDVVLVGTQEDVSENKGLNLLSGLELQFGDPLTRQAGFSAGRSITDDRTAANNDTFTRTFTRLISIPAVNYSLNIFNTLSGRNEILARPSLVALANERSEFFSGVDVIAAAVSGGDGAPVSINKQIGVKLSIVPEFLPGDRIKLKVEAERTFITTPSRSVVFNFRLDTSKTNLNANVVMKFGETLVLGGLTEKETENTRDAVPLLGDLPIIQYIFARQGVREYRKSVLILLTPRRAQYANQGDADRAAVEAKLTELERSLSRFEERNRNWFVPRSTLAEAVAASESNALFQEFKTGDFTLERWNTRDTHEKRLQTLQNFLFF